MNVIVSNKQKDIIDNANIDAIKDLNGLFNVDDLIAKFKNYFFSKMILDATSIVNFTSDEVLQKLADGIGAERLVILLPAVPAPPKEFVDKLNSFKIYNFSNDINEVVKLIDNPKTQNDMSSSDLNSQGSFYVDNSVKEDDDYQEANDFSLANAMDSMTVNNNPIEMPNEYVDNNEVYHANTDTNNNLNGEQSINNIANVFDNINFVQNPETNNVVENSETVTNNVETTNNIEQTIPEVDNSVNNDNVEITNNLVNNDTNNMFLNYNILNNVNNKPQVNKVIGFKNITLHAGSTSLIYMLYKTIAQVLNKKVTAYEIDSDNFKYYQDQNMISCSNSDVQTFINSCNSDIILIDLNNYTDLNICNDVLFLVEPSVIRLNRLMMENSNIFGTLQGKKVVLNMSLLNENEVNAFSNEAKVPIFYNIPPLNDRIVNNILVELLDKLEIK